jgi:demethoxyubiquinone hydroxylase (CLK1/Coq7/Cat5 family)
VSAADSRNHVAATPRAVFDGVVADDRDPGERLVRILQDAHAGELAAALAYRGHWQSFGAGFERDEIRRNEDAEWHHRRLVARLLDRLGSGPRRRRELVMWATGRFFGSLCFVGGYFGPMYAAGRLEAMNVGQYEEARALASRLGLTDAVAQLEAMRVEEDRHERWFGDRIRDHWLLPVARRLFTWAPPGPLPVGEQRTRPCPVAPCGVATPPVRPARDARGRATGRRAPRARRRGATA